jgi:hypothetical protein
MAKKNVYRDSCCDPGKKHVARWVNISAHKSRDEPIRVTVNVSCLDYSLQGVVFLPNLVIAFPNVIFDFVKGKNLTFLVGN